MAPSQCHTLYISNFGPKKIFYTLLYEYSQFYLLNFFTILPPTVCTVFIRVITSPKISQHNKIYNNFYLINK